MKKFLILILIAAAAFSGWWFGRRDQSHEHAASTRRVLFYQSAMHPWVKSDKPGRCTICGMELSPVYEGESGYDADTKLVSLGKQGVTVTGIETVPVVKKIIRRTIRVAGMVDDDDSTHRRISATAEGRIEKLFVNFVGAEVEAGQPLASLYSPCCARSSPSTSHSPRSPRRAIAISSWPASASGSCATACPARNSTPQPRAARCRRS